jgi:hypothetical protein
VAHLQASATSTVMKFREELARRGEDVGVIKDIIEDANRRDQSRPQYKCQPFHRGEKNVLFNCHTESKVLQDFNFIPPESKFQQRYARLKIVVAHKGLRGTSSPIHCVSSETMF